MRRNGLRADGESYSVLSVERATVGDMDNRADLLMVGSVVSGCADCGGERIFVPVDDSCGGGACEFCCTTCGAAILIDPLITRAEATAAIRSLAG